jgi:hypothetical protein
LNCPEGKHAPPENPFQRLPLELRKKIILMSCIVEEKKHGTLRQVRSVDRQFRADSGFMQTASIRFGNDYLFLMDEPACDVEHWALNFGAGECEITACLVKVLGEAKGSLQSLYLGCSFGDFFNSSRKVSFFFQLLGRCSLLSRLVLDVNFIIFFWREEVSGTFVVKEGGLHARGLHQTHSYDFA